jgi:hypothetical protein
MPDAFFCQEERSLDNYEDNNTQHTKRYFSFKSIVSTHRQYVIRTRRQTELASKSYISFSANHFLKHIIARECDYRLCSAICIKEEVEGKPLTIDDSPNLSSCTL